MDEKILLIGLGGTGVQTLSFCKKMNPYHQNIFLLGMDFDILELERSALEEGEICYLSSDIQSMCAMPYYESIMGNSVLINEVSRRRHTCRARFISNDTHILGQIRRVNPDRVHIICNLSGAVVELLEHHLG